MALFKAELRAAGLELDVPQLDALVAVLISELFSCAEDFSQGRHLCLHLSRSMQWALRL